jgi:hypothetical protein
MKIFKKKEGQGATEYLLILAAVLVVVAIAVYYVTRTTPKPNIQLTAQKSTTDNTAIILVATGGTDTCAAADWQYAVYLSTETATWTAGTATLSSTTDIVLKTGLAAGTYSVKVQHKPSGQYFVDTTITI